MKIWMLMENTAREPRFAAEHGLSLYIEACGKRILFDMGQSQAFAENAQKLGVDLAKVDFAVLSHGHYDHGGGLKCFLEINDHAPVYLSRHAFGQHFNAKGKDIGLDPALQDNPRLVFTGDFLRLDDHFELSSMNEAETILPIDSAGLTAHSLPETFRHEQYLLIRENGLRVLISGCSHKGVCNLAHWFRPDVLIGGFHFKTLDPQGEGRETLECAADFLRNLPAQYYTCHCTGTEQYEFMKQRMGDKLRYAACGDIIAIEGCVRTR